MKHPLMRWVGLFVILAIIAGLVFGYLLYNKPHRSAADGTAIVISSASLAEAYNKDEAHANTLYLGKVLQLTGTVEGVQENQQHGKIIMLAGDALSAVQCVMLDNQAIVTKGNNVTIRGFCNGFLADVVMDRCILVVSDKSNK